MNSELYDELEFGDVDLVQLIVDRALNDKENGPKLHASLIRSSSDYEDYKENFKLNKKNRWGLEYEKMLMEKEYKERKESDQ